MQRRRGRRARGDGPVLLEPRSRGRNLPVNAVEISGLRQAFDGHEILALDAFCVEQGACQLVSGPSGSGKTTLLHLIAGLQRPLEGTITVVDMPLAGLRPATLDRFRGRHIGIVFQHLHLLSSLTALGNVLAAQYLAGVAQDERRCLAVLDELGVAHRADARPDELSRGEAQRVALARAVINEPALLLADEPTASLDDASCEAVAALLLAQAGARGATLIVATHDARLARLFDQRLVLGA